MDEDKPSQIGDKAKKKREAKEEEKKDVKQKRNFKEFTHIFEAIISFDSVGENLKEFIFNHHSFRKIWERNVQFMNAEVTKANTDEAESAEVKPIETYTS